MKSKELYVALQEKDAEHFYDYVISIGGSVQWVAPLEAWPNKQKVLWELASNQPLSVCFRFDRGLGKISADASLVQICLDPPEDDNHLRYGRLYCSVLDLKDPAVAQGWSAIADYVKKTYKKTRVEAFITSKGVISHTVFVAPQVQKWLSEPGHSFGLPVSVD